MEMGQTKGEEEEKEEGEEIMVSEGGSSTIREGEGIGGGVVSRSHPIFSSEQAIRGSDRRVQQYAIDLQHMPHALAKPRKCAW